MADTKASFLWAIKQQESGGDYNIVNQSSGALGAYQVMPANVPSWTKQALGKSLTPSQFLSNPSAQDAVANKILGGYYDQYGARGAAAMWYSGQPDPNKTYGSPSVADYVKQVIARMTTSSPVGQSDSGTGATQTDFSMGGILGQGLTSGLVSAFKSIVPPVLKWLFWLLESGIGFAAIVVGGFLIAQKSEVVQTVQSTLAKQDKKENQTRQSNYRKAVRAQQTAQNRARRTAAQQAAREARKASQSPRKAAPKPRSKEAPDSRSPEAPKEES